MKQSGAVVVRFGGFIGRVATNHSGRDGNTVSGECPEAEERMLQG